MNRSAQDGINALYRFADALQEANVRLEQAPYGTVAAFDALVDQKIYPGDMGDLAKKICAIADACQALADVEAESLDAAQ